MYKKSAALRMYDGGAVLYLRGQTDDCLSVNVNTPLEIQIQNF